MTEFEFIGYVEYLKKIFPVAKLPEVVNGKLVNEVDKEAMRTLYEPFRYTAMAVARKAAEQYMCQEGGYFNYAKLLQYKNKLEGKNEFKIHEEDRSCPVCKGKGFVKLIFLRGSLIYDSVVSCVCSSAIQFGNKPPIDGDTLARYTKVRDSNNYVKNVDIDKILEICNKSKEE